MNIAMIPHDSDMVGVNGTAVGSTVIKSFDTTCLSIPWPLAAYFYYVVYVRTQPGMHCPPTQKRPKVVIGAPLSAVSAKRLDNICRDTGNNKEIAFSSQATKSRVYAHLRTGIDPV